MVIYNNKKVLRSLKYNIVLFLLRAISITTMFLLIINVDPFFGEDRHYFASFGLLFVLFSAYFFYIEQRLLNSDYTHVLRSLTFQELIIEIRDKMVLPFVVVIFLFGVLAYTSLSGVPHANIAIAMFSIIIGIVITGISYKAQIVVSTNKNISKYILYIIGILLSIIIALYFLRVNMSSYVLISFIPVGIFIATYNIYYKRKLFRRHFKISQDYFFLSNIEKLSTSRVDLKLVDCYVNEHYSTCVRKINRALQKNNLGSEQKRWLIHLKIRSLIYLNKRRLTLEAIDELKALAPPNYYIHYYNYAYSAFVENNFVKAEQILKDALEENPNNDLLVLNYSYILNKNANFLLSQVILHRHQFGDQLNNVMRIIGLNNYAYAVTRDVLEKNYYFNLLSKENNSSDQIYYFAYDKLSSETLRRASNYIDMASILNCNSDIEDLLKKYKTKRSRDFLLNETKILNEYAQGNFMAAINRLNKQIEIDSKRPTTRLYLSIIHATLGHEHTAKNNLREYKVLMKKKNISATSKNVNLVLTLLSKSNRELRVIPNYAFIEEKQL